MAGGKVVVDAQLFQGMLNYLAKCSYQEVAPLLVGLQSKVSPYVEPKAEKAEPKAVDETVKK